MNYESIMQIIFMIYWPHKGRAYEDADPCL